MTFVCALCGHRFALEVVSFPSYPAILIPMPLEVARSVVRAPLTLVACRACGHFQVAQVDPDLQRLLYENYYRHYEVDTLETMVPMYREPFNRLVESLATDGLLPNGRLLEIGCSSGAMIPFLSRFCSEYTGVDPSERIEIARSRFPQHTFIRSYFPVDVEQQHFDVAVTQFNLEHIEHVRSFVSALADAVVEGGILLVQVPDAGYFLRTRQPNFVAHEHVHYFRRDQLSLLLGSHAFEVERWGEEGPSIICAARRVNRAAGAFDSGDVLEDAVALRELASDLPPIPAKPVFYGVGLTLHWLLAKLPALASDAVVVDDNPGYQGKGVPGYDMRIEKPSRELLDGRDVVLTLNAIYHDRVLKRLRAMNASIRVHRIAS